MDGWGWIRGVIGVSGPYDFLPMSDPVYVDMFHGHQQSGVHAAATMWTGVRQPMLLATGTDPIAPWTRATPTAWQRKLRSFGSEVTVIKYKDTGHIGIILSLVPGFRGQDQPCAGTRSTSSVRIDGRIDGRISCPTG